MIGRKPIHLIEPDDRKKTPELKGLHIDIGAADGDAAKAVVRIGDVAVIAGEPLELPGDRWVAAGRWTTASGCFVALEAARLVSEAGGAPGDVIAVGTAQEENDLAGAHTALYGAAPRRRDRRRRHPRHRRPGRGRARERRPRPRVGSRDRPGLAAQPERLRAALRDAPSARASRSRSRQRAATPGPTPTPCSCRAPASATGLVQIPLRYMHSPVELVQLSDVHACGAPDRRVLPQPLSSSRRA